MSITQVSSTSSAMPDVVAEGSNSEMDKYAFLNLLTVQLANQDPTDPVDTDQMAQQQVMYAELEQMMNLNETMASFTESQNDMMLGIASVFNTLESTSFLGKDVSFYTDEVYVGEDGSYDELFYDLSETANVGYTVTDQNGSTVKVVDQVLTTAENGVAIGWDGTDASGNAVEAGTYTIALNVTNTDNVALSGSTYGHETVSSVDFRDGTPVLTFTDGREVNVTQILAVGNPTEEN